MKTIDDLVSLKMYSAANRLYIPVNDDNKRKNACIMFLGNESNTILDIIDSPVIVNNNGLYRSYYMNKDVEAIINHEGQFISAMPNINEVITEEISFSKELEYAGENGTYKIIINPSSDIIDSYNKIDELKNLKKDPNTDIVITSDNDSLVCVTVIDRTTHEIIYNKSFGVYKNGGYEDVMTDFCKKVFNAIPMQTESVHEEAIYKNTAKSGVTFKYNSGVASSIKEISKVYNNDTAKGIYAALNNEINMDGKTINVFIYNKNVEVIKARSNYNKLNTICIVSPTGFDEDKQGPYDMYLKHELALLLIRNINPKVDDILAIYIAMYISGQYKLDMNSVRSDGAKIIANIDKKYGGQKIVELIKKNNIDFVQTFSIKSLTDKVLNTTK